MKTNGKRVRRGGGGKLESTHGNGAGNSLTNGKRWIGNVGEKKRKGTRGKLCDKGVVWISNGLKNGTTEKSLNGF